MVPVVLTTEAKVEVLPPYKVTDGHRERKKGETRS